MPQNALTLPRSTTYLRAFSAVQRAADAGQLSPRTFGQYTRALLRAESEGVNLLSADDVASYAAGLPSSSRGFFAAAVRTMAKGMTAELKANVTPETLPEVQAALYRLEALGGAIKVPAAKGTKARTWLNSGQVERLTAAPDRTTAVGLRDAVAIGLMVGAGLRREEAAGMAWDWLVRQGERWVISVTGKGRKMRSVPISAELVALLDQWRTIAPPVGKNGRVLRRFYRGGRLGGALSAGYLREIVMAYSAAVNVELRPHDLRRSYAKIGRKEGGQALEQIKLLLGHSSINTTLIYTGEELDLESTASDYVPIGR